MANLFLKDQVVRVKRSAPLAGVYIGMLATVVEYTPQGNVEIQLAGGALVVMQETSLEAVGKVR
jgi:hypothetical protein